MRGWLSLPNHGWWVPAPAIPAFVRWLASRPGSVRSKLAPFRPFRPSADAPTIAAELAPTVAAVPMRADAIRVPRDSSRVQIFDFKQRCVLQVIRHGANLKAELALRDHADGLATPVLAVLDDGRAYVEPLLRPTHLPTTADAARVLDALAARFYAPRVTTAGHWAATLKAAFAADSTSTALLAALVAHIGPDRALTVTRVHGDVNPGNLYPVDGGHVWLGDWEYGREALYTYDIWLAARYWPDLAFATRAARSPLAELPTRWLEAAHRLEWLALLESQGPTRAAGLKAALRAELKHDQDWLDGVQHDADQ